MYLKGRLLIALQLIKKMEKLTALQEYGILGTFLVLVLGALAILFKYINKIEARTNNEHIKREKDLQMQITGQRTEFEKFLKEREDKLIGVITDSNKTHIENTKNMNGIIKDMGSMFAEINDKNNKQHLELSGTIRTLVLDHISKSQDLFMNVVVKNTEALSNFKSNK